MATERLSMRQAKEILRQKWLLERTHREIARSVGVGVSTVSDLAKRARNAGIDCWDAVEPLGEDEVEQRLYGLALMRKSTRPGPDPAELDIELRRKGVTLQLLHLEYLDRHPDGYRYTQFCQIYRDWQKRQRPTMRQVHRAGEKLFVDYSGAKPSIVDPHTGEVRDVELFVAVLGASSYTYAEATLTQSSRDWIRSHENAFAFFGGATELVVPDQLKSGVTKPCRYEPGVQRTYEELLCHYGAIPLRARQRKRRDKAKADVGVQVAQRWILARLRNQLFYSLAELNARFKELLRELNGRAMRAYGGVVASSSSVWTSRCSDRSPNRASSTGSGTSRSRASTITSTSKGTITRHRTRSVMRPSTSAFPRARSSCGSEVSGSRRTCAVIAKGATRPTPLTCRPPTAPTRSGLPRA